MKQTVPVLDADWLLGETSKPHRRWPTIVISLVAFAAATIGAIAIWPAASEWWLEQELSWRFSNDGEDGSDALGIANGQLMTDVSLNRKNYFHQLKVEFEYSDAENRERLLQNNLESFAFLKLAVEPAMDAFEHPHPAIATGDAQAEVLAAKPTVITIKDSGLSTAASPDIDIMTSNEVEAHAPTVHLNGKWQMRVPVLHAPRIADGPNTDEALIAGQLADYQSVSNAIDDGAGVNPASEAKNKIDAEQVRLTIATIEQRDPAELVRMLGSSDGQLSQAALLELTRRRWGEAELQLAIELATGNSQRRLELLERVIASSNPVPWLTWMAEDGDRVVRRQAVSMLGSINNDLSRKTLKHLAQRERDPEICDQIQHLLVAATNSKVVRR